MLYILIIIVFLLVLPPLLNISSNSRITSKNKEFISDIYDACTDNYKIKITKLIDWHTAYNHPFLVERSIKTNRSTGEKNNLRFAVYIDLGCFIDSRGYVDEKKWLQFSSIITLPIELEKRCLEYIIKGGGDVDLIWGLDSLEDKEKIYLEYPKLGKIESNIVKGRKILETYQYNKRNITNSNTVNFMYTRTNSKGIQDSYHYVLKNPIPMGPIDKYKIYIVSYSPISNTETLYYRVP
jgi:hypothetical protein